MIAPTYVGNSPRQCKIRQQEHAASVVEYVNDDKKSTAFAEHLGEHFKEELGMKGIGRDQKLELWWNMK